MKKLILIITLSFILLGCGNSNTAGTTKIIKYFKQSESGPVFTGEIDTEYLQIVKTELDNIKIIDTNETYQAYSLELNQSFKLGHIGNRLYRVGEEYKQYFKPQQAQIIDFEQNRLFLYGISGYAGNGFKEEIYLLSESEAQLIITKRPYKGLVPQSYFLTIFAYIIDREIKTLHLSETLTIDLNDTIYY